MRRMQQPWPATKTFLLVAERCHPRLNSAPMSFLWLQPPQDTAHTISSCVCPPSLEGLMPLAFTIQVAVRFICAYNLFENLSASLRYTKGSIFVHDPLISLSMPLNPASFSTWTNATRAIGRLCLSSDRPRKAKLLKAFAAPHHVFLERTQEI